MAASLGLNKEKFEACLAGGSHRTAILADEAEAQSLGINGTPSFLINGALYEGSRDEEGFAKTIQDELDHAAKAKLAANGRKAEE